MYNNLTALGSSSLYSTTEDMVKWAANLSTAKVGGRSVIDRMFQEGQLNNGEDIGYAFGLGVGQYYNNHRISHSGSWLGFRTQIVYFPEKDLSVVVLRNDRGNAGRIAYSIAKTLLVDGSQNDDTQESEEEEVQAVALDKTQLEAFTGTYRLGPAWYVTIMLKEDRLMTQATDEDTFVMTPHTENKFWVEAYGSYIEFVKNDEGEVTQFLYRGMECPKQTGQKGVPEEKRSMYLGTYFNDELEARYEVILEDGELALKHYRYGIIGLIPGWDDDFRGERWFLGSVDFFRDGQGKISGFKTWNERSRNNVFVKID